MSGGIRATVTFNPEEGCPIVEHARATGAHIEAVRRSVPTGDDTPTVTEYVAPVADGIDDVAPVFEGDGQSVYRMKHDGAPSCPCEYLGVAGCPLSRYIADQGELTIVFYVADYEELRSVVKALRDSFSSLSVQRFIRAPVSAEARDMVSVDRGQLTDRQLEVLATAYSMGYFDRPRRANATEIAATLDIDPSTLSEHLGVAQKKLFEDVLEGFAERERTK